MNHAAIAVEGLTKRFGRRLAVDSLTSSGMEARRYLRGAGSIRAMAIDGDYLYALTAVDSQKRRMVQAFRVSGR